MGELRLVRSIRPVPSRPTRQSSAIPSCSPSEPVPERLSPKTTVVASNQVGCSSRYPLVSWMAAIHAITRPETVLVLAPMARDEDRGGMFRTEAIRLIESFPRPKSSC